MEQSSKSTNKGEGSNNPHHRSSLVWRRFRRGWRSAVCWRRSSGAENDDVETVATDCGFDDWKKGRWHTWLDNDLCGCLGRLEIHTQYSEFMRSMLLPPPYLLSLCPSPPSLPSLPVPLPLPYLLSLSLSRRPVRLFRERHRSVVSSSELHTFWNGIKMSEEWRSWWASFKGIVVLVFS